MTDFQLEQGVCARLLASETGSAEQEELFNSPHTLQLLSIKKIPGNDKHPADRHRVVLSDGEQIIQAMIATQLNDEVDTGKYIKNCVIMVERFTCNFVADQKRVFIILSVQWLGNPNHRIGNPVNMNPSSSANGAGDVPMEEAEASQPRQASEPAQPPEPTPSSAEAYPVRPGIQWLPIDALSPYQNNWGIKARVTQKSDIKKWSNNRGEGQLFSVTLMDDTGEIRATAFNNAVDLLFTKLEENKVYFLCKARVSLAKKKFSNLSNDYELQMDQNTDVEECLASTNVPTVKYHFVPLSDLEQHPKDTFVDVIAVVKEASDVTEITAKATSRQLTKRELTLVDDSGYSVRLTLWGKQAQDYTPEDPSPVIAFKGVRVGEFNGRSLSMAGTSTMVQNPDLIETFKLRGWYDQSGSDQFFHAHTRQTGDGSGGGFRRDEMMSLQDVKAIDLTDSDQARYFSTRATIMHIKPDSIAYPACSRDGCQKKVVQVGDGWRCEKCNNTNENPNWRYIISMAVADYSGQAWLQGFNDAGTVIFNKDANEVMKIKDEDESQYNVILHRANCQIFNFTCRAKQDTFNDTTRVRYGIVRILPLNYKEECEHMLKVLQNLGAEAP